jgi:hypothetical protein
MGEPIGPFGNIDYNKPCLFGVIMPYFKQVMSFFSRQVHDDILGREILRPSEIVSEKDGAAIVEEIAKAAKEGDTKARRRFLRYLLPHHRLLLSPIDPPAARWLRLEDERVSVQG